jgi:hypothetical protein
MITVLARSTGAPRGHLTRVAKRYLFLYASHPNRLDGSRFPLFEGPVRTFISLLLVIMLMACPQLCRAEPLAYCADHCEGTGAPDDDSKTPPASDNEPVSCICAGAIRDSGRVSPSGDAPRCFAPATSFLIVSHPYLSPFIELPVDGAPPGRAPTGPHRLHLVLETFRC